MEDKPYPVLVSISCVTYNHSSYIRECLDGFLMQKTNFVFEVLIHDDASTDGTSDIINEYKKKYPDIIKPIYQTENQYSKGISPTRMFNYPRAKGKYIALCEGDDYWTDLYKLQKQVDFLEANPDYGMCYTQAKVFIQNQKSFSAKNIGKRTTSFEDLLHHNCIPTLTTCVRKNILDKYLEEVKPENQKWLMGDYPMWLWFSLYSKIFFLEEVMATYRELEESASHSSDISKQIYFELGVKKIKDFFLLYSNNRSLVLKQKINLMHYSLLRHLALKCENKEIIKKTVFGLFRNKERLLAFLTILKYRLRRFKLLIHILSYLEYHCLVKNKDYLF